MVWHLTSRLGRRSSCPGVTALLFHSGFSVTVLPPALQAADIPLAVSKVLEQLVAQGHEAYLVGGCVRDLLRGKHPKDFDIATSALPAQVQQAFPRVIPTGLQHGTVTVLSGQESVEVTTFRSEGLYLDGRRPSSVAFHTDVREDLSRRDFTINAMAFDPVGKRLVDPFGGQEDLSAGLIRCVGTAHDRFSEDGLRALRAVRFAAVLGFTIDSSTLAAIAPTVPIFRKVALERVREEFNKILLSPRMHSGLALLDQTGLLEEFLPEVSTTPAGKLTFEAAVAAAGHAPASLEVRLAALLHLVRPDSADAALDRLRYPRKTIERVGLLIREQGFSALHLAPDAELRHFLARVGEGVLADLAALVEATALAGPVDSTLALAQLHDLQIRLAQILSTRPPLNPKDLCLNGGQIMKVLGVGPSPVIGHATRFLMAQVFEDPARNSVDVLTRLLEAWMAHQRP